ncbi:MAG: thioredoxin family protein [Flavobacteriales bacterium]
MDYRKKWEKAMTYAEYRSLVSELLTNGRSTAPKQEEHLVTYSDLNQHRMNRLDKTFDPATFDLSALKGKMHTHVLVITEGWCGDAAQIIPVLNKTMEAVGIETRYLLRDSNVDLIDMFLTNGSRSIPVIIFLNSNFEVMASWGPRPAPLQAMFYEHKAAPEPKLPEDEFKKQMQLWYAKDKQQTMMSEWLSLADRL